MNRRHVWLPLGAAALLAACGSPPLRQPAPPVISRPAPPAEPRQPELAAFRAVLRGSEAVPRSDSPAQGELVAVLNRQTGLLRWKLTFDMLSGAVRAAHFHSPAMEGEVAERSAIMGALSLYLNFVNLFTLLLQLLGQREE